MRRLRDLEKWMLEDLILKEGKETVPKEIVKKSSRKIVLEVDVSSKKMGEKLKLKRFLEKLGRSLGIRNKCGFMMIGDISKKDRGSMLCLGVTGRRKVLGVYLEICSKLKPLEVGIGKNTIQIKNIGILGKSFYDVPLETRLRLTLDGKIGGLMEWQIPGEDV